MSGRICVVEHPTGALCVIAEATEESGRHWRSETYFLPDGVLFEDVVVPPKHPNTVQQPAPLPEGMTASELIAMVDGAVEEVTGRPGPF